jgi:hypothetical protein
MRTLPNAIPTFNPAFSLGRPHNLQNKEVKKEDVELNSLAFMKKKNQKDKFKNSGGPGEEDEGEDDDDDEFNDADAKVANLDEIDPVNEKQTEEPEIDGTRK